MTRLVVFLKRIIPHDSSAIYFFDGEGIRLHSLEGNSKEDKVVGEVIKLPVFLSDIRQVSNPIIISDANSNVNAREWGIHRETETWMAVPMSAHGRNIGCLTLESHQKDAFSESAARLIQAIANEAAIAFENARLFQEVERLSVIDPLTGLCNRRQFNASAQMEIQRSLRYNLQLSAIMMDIDHFKQVNDSYGHAAGDKVLIEIAEVCMREARLMNICSRYGGEEFCFLLPETALKGSHNLAERLRSAVTELHFEFNGRSFTVTSH